jgi:hypothetical protein
MITTQCIMQSPTEDRRCCTSRGSDQHADQGTRNCQCALLSLWQWLLLLAYRGLMIALRLPQLRHAQLSTVALDAVEPDHCHVACPRHAPVLCRLTVELCAMTDARNGLLADAAPAVLRAPWYWQDHHSACHRSATVRVRLQLSQASCASAQREGHGMADT